MIEFVEIAKTFIGRNEADGTHKEIIDLYNTICPLPRGHAMGYSEPWCACFVSACAQAARLYKFPFECSCNTMITHLTSLGLWEEKDDYSPEPGDLVFYDWQDSGLGDNKGTADHVGIVEKVTDTQITIIEGNYSNAVKRRTIKKNAKYIRGWGLVSKLCTPEPEIVHVVKAGDTLWSIARYYLGYGARYPDIMVYNKMSSTVIYKGQKIKIPKR